MKLSINDCRPCLERLTCQAAGFATGATELKGKAIEQGMKVLDSLFLPERVSPSIADEIHRTIRRVTRNPDPYRERKKSEREIARLLFQEIRSGYGDDFDSCVRLALLGNALDFFKGLEESVEEMRRPVELAIDHGSLIREKVSRAKKVLYLADNAGECFFDLPLVKKLRETTRATYVVKGFPVQNDITLEDLSLAGLLEKMGETLTTGTDTVGIDFPLASPEFKEQFETADLIFAKGMGYYETLSELPIYGRIVYCLKAKCQPVAASLGVPLNSYVLVLQ